MCSCLLVYECVVDSTAEHGVWALMKKGVATRGIANLAPATESRNRTLLLGGRRDGYICVFDWETGDISFKIEAHGIKGVLSMIANSKADQVISAGMDNVIKVWRLYPFAQEALAPLMSFYCAHTPSHMTTIKKRLCVTFQDPSTATFNTVLYNLKDKVFASGESDKLDPFIITVPITPVPVTRSENLNAAESEIQLSTLHRFDHRPDDDHMDLVTGISACPRMKLFATCSMDCTVRIWNEANMLVRLLRLNTYPYSIGFCSQKGDLLLGNGDHLFKIPYTTYMPRVYRNRMVSMKFEDEPSEDPVSYSENLLNLLSKSDVKRLKNSHSSFKFDHFVDVLSEEEEQEVVKEKLIKQAAFSVLEAREQELLKIRDGDLKAKTKPAATKETRSEAFFNYMKIYYDKPKMKLPEEDPFPEDTVQKQLAGGDTEPQEEYRGVEEPKGFFPARPKTPVEPLKPAYPINHGGFIPNSVLVKILWPPPRPVIPAKRESTYVPPSLTADQLAQIQTISKLDVQPRRSVTFDADISTRVFEFDWGDEDEDEEDEKPQSPDLKVVDGQSSLMSKMQDIMNTTPTPKEEEDMPDSIKSASPFQDEHSSPSPAASHVSTPPKRVIKPAQPIKKLVSKPWIPDPKPRTPPSPSPSPLSVYHSPTPPPPTPLPGFITQFQGTEWFDKYFPSK